MADGKQLETPCPVDGCVKKIRKSRMEKHIKSKHRAYYNQQQQLANNEVQDEIRDQNRDQIRDHFRDQIRDQNRDHFRDQNPRPRDQNRDQIRDQNRDQIRDHFRDQNEISIDDRNPLTFVPNAGRFTYTNYTACQKCEFRRLNKLKLHCQKEAEQLVPSKKEKKRDRKRDQKKASKGYWVGSFILNMR